MRKNLLLLIMFCLVATIGAKADVTSAVLSTDGKTLTFTDCKAGDVASYLNNTSNAKKIETITSLVVNGAMNSNDMKALKKFTVLSSLDLSAATGLSNSDLVFNGSNNENLQNAKLFTTLETIKFPKTGPTEIPTKCLYGYSVANVIIPSGYNKIGENAFCSCKSLHIIYIPEGVTEICANAFQDAVIQSVRLPNTLTKIDAGAFWNCNQLTSITIPENVEYIGANAFGNCNHLKDIYALRTTTTALGENAFSLLQTHGSGGGYPTTQTNSINRESYWNDTNENHMTLLHYPKNCESTYSDETYKNEHYTLTGTDYKIEKGEVSKELKKYPSREEGEALWGIWNNARTTDNGATMMSWKEFVLSTETKDDEEIDIPHVVSDRWYTMCFNFPMTKGQLETAFGAGTEVCRFQGVKYIKDNNNNFEATLDFSKDLYDPKDATIGNDTKITEAGRPYMIHPAIGAEQGNTTVTYHIAGLKTSDYKTSLIDEYGAVYDNKNLKSTVTTNDYTYYPKGAYVFKGTFSSSSVAKGTYYLGLWNNKSDDVDGNRAFFYKNTDVTLTLPAYAATLYEYSNYDNYHGSSAMTTASAKRTGIALGNDAVIFTSESSTTGIENIESESNETSAKFADKVFSISGQLVRTGSSSLEGLAKGMYIVNGKKYIVR